MVLGNLNRISGLWGRLISLGKSIAQTDTFKSMKVLITAYYFFGIQKKILFTLDDEGHRVVVREIKPTIH